jgi:glycyl-tRNA synthetase beta chain
MTWGRGTLRWVRPLKRILCVFDGEIVPLSIDGIDSGDTSEGHRFMGSAQPFKARDFDAYADGLARHFVVVDPEERKERIMDAARTLCFARNFELVEDDGLLDEVSGLAEWPTPILGDMDPDFLDLPPEVIRTSMRTHQKYFRGARSADRLPGPALRHRRQHRGGRRRRGHRGRQRQGAGGPLERRPVLLGRGPEDQARRPA